MTDAKNFFQNFDPNMEWDLPSDFLEGVCNQVNWLKENDTEIEAFLNLIPPSPEDTVGHLKLEGLNVSSPHELSFKNEPLSDEDDEDFEYKIISMVNNFEGEVGALSQHEVNCNQTTDCCQNFLKGASQFAEKVGDFLDKYFYPRFNTWHKQKIYPDVEPPKIETLDQFEVWFNAFYDILCKLKNQVRDAYAKHNTDWTQTLEYSLIQEKLINNLVRRSCIFVEQPNQVLMKKSKFYVKLKFLIALPKKNNIEAFLIPESEAVTILSHIEEPSEKLVHMKPTKKVIKLKEPLVTYINTSTTALKYGIKITDVTRAKTINYVAEQVYRIIFLIDYKMSEIEKTNTIWLLSVPLVVIVHAKQECQAWGKIMWENTIAKNNLSFENGYLIRFPYLLERLNQRFFSSVGTELNESNKNACARFFTFDVPASELVVTYDSFCKTKVVKHTFWDWFYHALKLLKDVPNLKDMINKGYIEGFISFDQTISQLVSCQNGTFLIRFSESQLGTLTISYTQNHQVFHVSGLNKDKFSSTSLVDIIQDSTKLSLLYPNIEKSILVSKYQTKPDKQAKQKAGPLNRGYQKFVNLFQS